MMALMNRNQVMALMNRGDSPLVLFMIPTAWKGSFKTLLGGIFSFLSDASENTIVWLDCIGVNQHEDTNLAENKADVEAFEEVIKTSKGGTIVVVDFERCNPATRAWCLYEWDHSLHHHGQSGLNFVNIGKSQLASMIKGEASRSNISSYFLRIRLQQGITPSAEGHWEGEGLTSLLMHISFC